MDARSVRAALLAVVLLASTGASYRSPNFVVNTQDPQLAQKIAQTAEQYRRELAISWLGKAMPNWSAPCEMTVRVGPKLGAGGATTFVFDQGEVFGWQMTIQGSAERILDSVLPHEITHMIFASHFRRPLPRWADEGAATSTEHASERARYHRMLVKFLQTGRGIAFNQMFAMTEYPGDVMPLYSQGFTLAEYLIALGGRREFVNYLADGMRTGDWAGMTRRHYGMADLAVLQADWLAWVAQGCPAIQPRTGLADATPQPELLASAAPTKRPRPEPNLLYRIPKDGPNNRVIASRASVPATTRETAGLQAPLASVASLPPGNASSSSWPPAGAGSPATSLSASRPSTVDPFRAHLTRPQPVEPAREIILEWARQ